MVTYNHMGHSATQLNSTTAVIHGGTQFSTWCFDLSDNYWTQLTQLSQNQPQPTGFHVAAVFNDTTLLIYGGYKVRAHETSHEVWILTFHNLQNCSGEWINMTNRIQGGHLPPRECATATSFRNFIVIYGGRNPNNPSDKYTSLYDQSVTVIDTTQTGPNLQIQQILISPPIPVRYHHSLSSYTSDGLLLYYYYYYYNHDGLEPIRYVDVMSYKVSAKRLLKQEL